MTSPKSSRALPSTPGGEPLAAGVAHPSDDLLERYAMGVVRDEAELAPLEEHLLACPECVARAEREDDYVQSIKSSLRQTWIQVIESDS